MKTATKKTESREEERERNLREIGKSAYESIEEMVKALTVSGQDDDGEDIEATDEQREEAREAIQEDALSCEVRSGWTSPGELASENTVGEEFCLLLSTGGPAVRIIGELSEQGEPTRATLEVQDWFTAWTEYRTDVDPDVLLAYAGCFYFGEG